MHEKSLAFVGMPGSGKSTCVEYLHSSREWPTVYFGGIVIEEVVSRNLEVNETNERFVREEMRVQEGKDVLAKRVGRKVLDLYEQTKSNIIIDGLYSWSEYKSLDRQLGESLVIAAVVSPRHLRYQRLANRPERPLSREESLSRDISEIENLEKGGPIAFADHYILNGSQTALRELEVQADAVAESL